MKNIKKSFGIWLIMSLSVMLLIMAFNWVATGNIINEEITQGFNSFWFRLWVIMEIILLISCILIGLYFYA